MSIGRSYYTIICGPEVLGRFNSFRRARNMIVGLRPKWPQADIRRVLCLGGGRYQHSRWFNGEWIAIAEPCYEEA